jgi:hypothetical protein
MLYEDESGKLLMSEEVDDLSPWEIDDRKIHVFDEMYTELLFINRT